MSGSVVHAGPECFEACGCAGFVPPGAFRDRAKTIHDRETDRPPPGDDEHEAAL